MNLTARLGDEEFALVIRRGKKSDYVVTIDGVEYRLDLTEPETNLYSVLVGDESFEAAVRPNGEMVNVDVAGRRYEVEVEDPMTALTRSGRLAVDGIQVVRSIMAGKVLEVMVQEGATVAQGDPLLVIEAMKMENEIRSPKDGTITQIQITPGQTIESGTDLLTVE
jgi:biotin carboxyl carrier protein